MTHERRVALVTGGSRGIGRAIAERLGADGAAVIVNYRANQEAAAEVVDTIERAGGTAAAVQADVTDLDQLGGLLDTAEERFGQLDIVVGNAYTGVHKPIVETSIEEFDATFATNTRAGFLLLREAATRVREGGRVVMISSGATVLNAPTKGVYGASKIAIEFLVRVLARELGPRQITVNTVVPGAVRTDGFFESYPAETVDESVKGVIAATPFGRLGEPEDIAEVVAFLASPGAKWVTGQTISAAGGLF